MSKKKIVLFIFLIVILLFVNITLATLIFKTLKEDTDDEASLDALYLSSEDIVEDASNFILQHIDYINNGDYYKAYNNLVESFKESVSQDDYTFEKSLMKKLYSPYEIIDYAFDSEHDNYIDNNITYDKKITFKFNMRRKSLVLDEFSENEYIFDVLYKNNSFYIYTKEEDYKNNLALYYASFAYEDFMKRDYNSCLANVAEGIRYNPNMLSIYNVKGQAEFMLNKYEDSIQSMNRALMNDNMFLEDKAYAYAILGASHANLGDLIKGEEFIDKALALTPDDEYIKSVKVEIQDKLNSSTEGYKTLVYNNGDKYIGNIKDGKKHGYGIMYHADGTIFEGQWKDDWPSGIGEFKLTNGSTQYGVFKKGALHGKGVIKLSGDNVILGNFSNGNPNGKCVQYYQGNYFKVFYEDGKVSIKEHLKSGVTNLDVPWFFTEEWNTYSKRFVDWVSSL